MPAEAIFLCIGANVALLCMVAVLGFLANGLLKQSVHHARASKVRPVNPQRPQIREKSRCTVAPMRGPDLDGFEYDVAPDTTAANLPR